MYAGNIQTNTDGTVRMGAGQPAVYNAIVAAIMQCFGYLGDQILIVNGQSESLLQSELRLRTMDAPLLDIAIHDFFGDSLPRLPNEADASYLARALTLLFQPKLTRPAIQNMLTALTGQTAHIINPDVPGDVGGLTAVDPTKTAVVGGHCVYTKLLGPPSYLGVDVGGAPFRYANPNGRGTKLNSEGFALPISGTNFGFGWQGFIDTTWPENFGAQGNPVTGYATVLNSDPPVYTHATITGAVGPPDTYTNISGGGIAACSNPQVVNGKSVYATVVGDPTCALFNPRGLTAADQANGQASVLAAIDKLRAAGITIYARCLPAQYLADEGFTS
jgi:hypothetical protein